MNWIKYIIYILAVVIYLKPMPSLACASCFGKSDSQLAHGLNAGIFTLLGFVFIVLGAIAAFGIFLWHRANTHSTGVSKEISELE